MHTQTKIATSINKIPPSNLRGRNTASIFVQALRSHPWPSPLASAAKRSRRTRVRSSLTRASSSRRSFAGSPSSRPSLRISSCRWRSRFCSSSEAVFALKVGADIAGADLINATGSRAKPAAVYRAYIRVPMVMSSPRAKVKARSPSIGEVDVSDYINCTRQVVSSRFWSSMMCLKKSRS